MTDTPIIETATAPDLYQQYPDLTRLARVLRRSQGEFSLFFAECNLPTLRQQLATTLSEQLESPPVKVDLSQFDTNAETIDEIISGRVKNSYSNTPVFLFGLERLLPSLSNDKLRSTVQQLNWRRSSLARLQRPLVIWLPRYALDLLAEQTPDFYDWYSGVFNFPVQAEQREQSEANAFQNLKSDTGVHAANYMSSDEKKRWLGTLKELLQEHPTEDQKRAKLLYNLGYLLSSMGDKETAIQDYQEALKIQQKIGDRVGESTTLNNISQVFKARDDYATALKYLQTALKITQDIDYKHGEGATLNNISQIHAAHGDYETALNHLKKALAIRQKIGDKSGEGTTLNNISQIHVAHGDYETALNHLKKALAIQQEIGDKYGEGRTLNNISQIYYERGDYDTTFNYLQRALEIRQKIDDVTGLCVTLFNIGHIHRQNEEVQEAVAVWANVYQLAKKMNLTQILDALENLAPQIGIEDGLEGWERLSNSTSPDEALSIPQLSS